MEITEESIYQRYSQLETSELIAMKSASELTEIASSVLEKVLTERGITSEDHSQITDQIKQQEKTVKRIPLASLTQRVFSILIDTIIALVLLVASTLLLKLLIGNESEQTSMIGLGVYFLYLLFKDALPNGQSIGKHFMKIAVVNKYSGKPCSIIESMVRNILLYVLWLIDIIFLASKNRQRLGDMAANTIVVNLPVNEL